MLEFFNPVLNNSFFETCSENSHVEVNLNKIFHYISSLEWIAFKECIPEFGEIKLDISSKKTELKIGCNTI